MRIIEEHSFVEGLPIFQNTKTKTKKRRRNYIYLCMGLFDEEFINSTLFYWLEPNK